MPAHSGNFLQTFRGTEAQKGHPDCPKPYSLKVWGFPQHTGDLRKLDQVRVWEGFTHAFDHLLYAGCKAGACRGTTQSWLRLPRDQGSLLSSESSLRAFALAVPTAWHTFPRQLLGSPSRFQALLKEQRAGDRLGLSQIPLLALSQWVLSLPDFEGQCRFRDSGRPHPSPYLQGV